MMKIEIGETDKFTVTREVTLKDGNSLVFSCPRCGKEVVLNAKSPSGEETYERHFDCKIEFELKPIGFNLVITGNG